MEKLKHSQLELFSELKSHSESGKRMGNPFFAYIWNYEKIILIIIGFIITGIVSFSLGVVKGQRIIMLKTNSNIDIATTAQPRVSVQTTEENLIQSPVVKENIIKETKPKEYIQTYTIQVASYKTKTHAQKEAQNLTKKGMSALVLSKGPYTILCVGNFSDKVTAKSLLLELKKRYRDCFIRRL